MLRTATYRGQWLYMTRSLQVLCTAASRELVGSLAGKYVRILRYNEISFRTVEEPVQLWNPQSSGLRIRNY